MSVFAGDDPVTNGAERDVLNMCPNAKSAPQIGGGHFYQWTRPKELSNLLANFIKENNIPVVVKQPYRFPQSVDSDPKETFMLAKKMLDEGILVSIDPTGTASARVSIRNLPFYAGSFSSFGIDKETALSLITLNPAKILGIDKEYGSLELGKSATLFISMGDALDIMSNKLTHAFISGRLLSLETHQTQLWRRYSNKFSN